MLQVCIAFFGINYLIDLLDMALGSLNWAANSLKLKLICNDQDNSNHTATAEFGVDSLRDGITDSGRCRGFAFFWLCFLVNLPQTRRDLVAITGIEMPVLQKRCLLSADFSSECLIRRYSVHPSLVCIPQWWKKKRIKLSTPTHFEHRDCGKKKVLRVK